MLTGRHAPLLRQVTTAVSLLYISDLFSNLLPMCPHADMTGCIALEQTATPFMQWSTTNAHTWASEWNAAGVEVLQGVMCHQPYTLPTNSNRTWEEVWQSVQGHWRSVETESCVSSSIESCPSHSDSETLTDEALTECESTAADLASRYPMAERGRCGHRQHWERMRGKRGFSYFVCRACGNGWRQPIKTLKNNQQTTPSKASHQHKQHVEH